MNAPIKVPKADYQGIATAYATTPIKLREVALLYGVSREAIRLIVLSVDPDAAWKHHRVVATATAQKAKQASWDKLTERCAEALAEDRHCVVCDAWVIRTTGTITCSPDCTEIWKVLRSFDQSEEHRRHKARTTLRSDWADEVAKSWARLVLSDSPPPANRRFLVPGSKRAQIIAAHRPEAYKELTAWAKQL